MEAVNQQRDIVFDGTMMWRPFVEQTIAMVRDHQHRYRRGPGYHRDPQGNVVERCVGRDFLHALTWEYAAYVCLGTGSGVSK